MFLAKTTAAILRPWFLRRLTPSRSGLRFAVKTAAILPPWILHRPVRLSLGFLFHTKTTAMLPPWIRPHQIWSSLGLLFLGNTAAMLPPRLPSRRVMVKKYDCCKDGRNVAAVLTSFPAVCGRCQYSCSSQRRPRFEHLAGPRFHEMFLPILTAFSTLGFDASRVMVVLGCR